MNKRCKHVEKDGFHVCGSYAFNLYKDDIDQGDLCDVHYWEVKAKREWIGLTRERILEIGRELGKKCRLGGNPNIDLDYAYAVEEELKKVNGWND
jgi:hypothetical protein